MASEADDLINGAYPADSVSTSDILARITGPSPRGPDPRDAYRNQMLERVRNTVPGPALPPLPDTRPSLRSYDVGASRGPDVTRPKDPLTPLYEGLSPTVAAANAGELAGRTRQAVGDQDWSKLAELFPHWAAFIGPRGAGNLAKAGLRHPDEWGGLNRLKWAEQQPGWVRPGSPEADALWGQAGWSYPTTFGGRMGKEGAQPITAIATPQFRLNETQLHPMRSGQAVMHRGEGMFPDMVHGIDEAAVAVPELMRYHTKYTVDPLLTELRGETDAAEHKMWVNAPTLQALNDTNWHEFGHMMAIPEGLTPSMGGQHQRMHPIFGTKAEKKLTNQAEGLEDLVRSLGDEPAAESRLAAMNPNLLQAARDEARAHRDQAAKAPGLAGYLALDEEKLARDHFLRGPMSLPEYMSRPPGSIDTYQRGALGSATGPYGLPMSYWRPPKQKQD